MRTHLKTEEMLLTLITFGFFSESNDLFCARGTLEGILVGDGPIWVKLAVCGEQVVELPLLQIDFLNLIVWCAFVSTAICSRARPLTHVDRCPLVQTTLASLPARKHHGGSAAGGYVHAHGCLTKQRTGSDQIKAMLECETGQYGCGGRGVDSPAYECCQVASHPLVTPAQHLRGQHGSQDKGQGEKHDKALV